MSKAYRKLDPTLPDLKITTEEKERYFITYRSYTKSTSLEPKKLLLCAIEEREHFGFGETETHDHILDKYRLELRKIEATLEPDTASLSGAEYSLVSILRENGLDKGLELYLSNHSKRSWYNHKRNLASKGIDINEADRWCETAKIVRAEMAEAKKDYLKKREEIEASRSNCDTWHEEVAHMVLNEKGGRILVAYMHKGKIYHKAYLQVSRSKVTNQGFSGLENDFTLEGPRNIVFYP